MFAPRQLARSVYAASASRLKPEKPVRETGSMPIGVLLVVVSIWVLGGAIELLSSTFAVFSIGRTGHFIGTALVPILAYACFREYTGSTAPIRTLALLMVIPALSISLAATNTLHEVMWFLPVANEAGQFLTRPDRWGPWFLYVHLPYSYAVVGAAILTLIIRSSAVAPAQRRGLLFLVAACVVPVVTTAIYDMGFGPNTISYVPLVFAAMLPTYAWLIIGEQIIEFTPLPYETVFQNMQDPVVVIDKQCRVIGLALYPGNASTLTGLLREADQAMYRAKARCHGVSERGGRDLLEKAI